MQVIPIKDKVSNFLVRLNSKIYLTCDDEAKGMELLESIDIKLVSKPYYSKSDSTFEIIPHRVNREVSMNVYPVELRKIHQIKDVRLKYLLLTLRVPMTFMLQLREKHLHLKL